MLTSCFTLGAHSILSTENWDFGVLPSHPPVYVLFLSVLSGEPEAIFGARAGEKGGTFSFSCDGFGYALL